MSTVPLLRRNPGANGDSRRRGWSLQPALNHRSMFAWGLHLGAIERMGWSFWKVTAVTATVVGLAFAITLLETIADAEPVTVLEVILDTLEKALVLTGAGGVVYLLYRVRADHRERLALIEELEVARVQGTDWRQRVQSQIEGIGAEIDRQFGDWGLTDAESEVGMLLIKGLTHKDIAALRGTAESTVRQQARSIYQKSNLPGKAAFSAYFLEDLLPPESLRQQGTGSAVSHPGGSGEHIVSGRLD